MLFRPATRILFAIIAMLALAVLSITIAMVSAWRTETVVGRALAENVSSMRAAERLEVALLQQRGYLARYMLDEGASKWRDELRSREVPFKAWLLHSQNTAHSPEERQILAKLEAAYRDYDAARQAAFAAFERGEVDLAKRILLGDVEAAFGRVFELCEQFGGINEYSVNEVLADVETQVRTVTLIVGVGVTLTISFGVLLLLQYFREVFRPLRRMVADAKHFTDDNLPGPTDFPEDELRAVGDYLRALMSRMAETRNSLEQSRRQLLHISSILRSWHPSANSQRASHTKSATL